MTRLLRQWPIVAQLLRYAGIGLLAFLVDFGLYVGLIEYGLRPLQAAPLGFLAGLVCNYLLATRFVFRQHRLADRKLEFVLYGTIGVLGLGINQVAISVALQYFHTSVNAAKLLATGVVFGFNFTLRRLALFPQSTVND